MVVINHYKLNDMRGKIKRVISYIFLLLMLGALIGCSNEYVDVEGISARDKIKAEEVDSDTSSGSLIEESNYEINI